VNGITRQSTTVADRQTVDIEGLRDRIVTVCAHNPLWERLSMAQKLRLIVEKGVETLEKEQESGGK
jgi:hypothetical protein